MVQTHEVVRADLMKQMEDEKKGKAVGEEYKKKIVYNGEVRRPKYATPVLIMGLIVYPPTT
jgi:hypothetical protein